MLPLSKISPLPNFLLYQIVWFACILGAASGLPLIGIGLALLVGGLHLAMARLPESELKVILLTGLIGGAWEYVVVNQGWVRYAGAGSSGFAPAWIIALWLAFATTFNVSLRWLQGRLWLASALGLVGGPLAWYAGQRMGALELPDPRRALTMIGAGWAVLMPLLLYLTHWLTTPTLPNTIPED